VAVTNRDGRWPLKYLTLSIYLVREIYQGNEGLVKEETPILQLQDRGYYMPAREYEFYLRGFNSISHE